MGLVHDEGMEAFLPQMATAILAPVEVAGIAPVDLAERGTEAIFMGRDQDQVDVAGHQAAGPDLGSRPVAPIAEQIEIMFVVALLEEHVHLPHTPAG